VSFLAQVWGTLADGRGTIVSFLLPGTATALKVLTYRALPMVVALSMMARCSTTKRLVATSLLAAAAFLASQLGAFQVTEVLVAYAALGFAAGLQYLVASRWRDRRLLLLLSLVLFVVMPGFIAANQGKLVLILGWELSLSAYSWCVHGAGKSFGDYVFFLFVNPTLVYPRRGTLVTEEIFDGRSVVRLLTGSAAFIASGAIATAGPALQVPWHFAGASRGAAKIGEIYFAHAGLAAIQIGLFRQLGWVVPERYVSPHSATSPRDFWSRWNTYIGAWARLYVFNELVRSLSAHGKRKGFGTRSAFYGAVVIASFVAVGLLHDVYRSVQLQEFSWTWTGWFLANGVIVCAWEIAAARGKRHGSKGRVSRIAARSAMVGLAICLANWLA
jgi:hypothetical protein